VWELAVPFLGLPPLAMESCHVMGLNAVKAEALTLTVQPVTLYFSREIR
jgi:hypothetical protein